MFEVFNEMFQELWILKRNKQKHKKIKLVPKIYMKFHLFGTQQSTSYK